MKVSVSNLGPIKNGEVSIKPLTVFLGPNNSGKTYMCYAIYYLLDWDLDVFDPSEMANIIPDAVQSELREIIQSIQEGKYSAESFSRIDNMRLKYIPHLYNAKALLAKDNFAKYIGANNNYFHNFKLTADITPDNKRFSSLGRVLSFFMSLYMTEVSKIALKSANVVSEKRLSFGRFFMGKMFEPLLSIAEPGLFFFPCFRNALSAMLSDTLFSTFKYAHTKGKIPKSLPKPIVDFIEFLKNTGEGDENDENDKVLFRIIKFMDDKILEGRVETIRKKNNLLPEVFYNYKNKIRRDILLSASAIQQVAPLALYIYTKAKKGDIVIIDEPEIHMHPQLQVKFAELVAALVNYGITVIMSTHTPYIVDHLNNLMLAKEILSKNASKKANVAKLLELKASDLELFLVDKEKVGAYLFKDNSIKSILEDGEIDWSDFGNVSDHVSMIRDKLENL